MLLHVRLSACPSVCHMGGSVKTVEIRLRNFHHTLASFCGGKFHPEILTGFPLAGAANKGGVGETSHFSFKRQYPENSRRYVQSYYD